MGRIGLALGGGGVAGTAHIGVLSALEEAGIRIDCIAGSSVGALVAALYAYGYTAAELHQMLPGISKKYMDFDYLHVLSRLFKAGSKIKGFVKGDKLQAFIAEKTKQAHMNELKLPVSITATDLTFGKQVIFASHGLERSFEDVEVIQDIRVADAVRASLSIPVVFKPYYLRDKVLIDGGLFDNCPVAAVRALGADRVIAVDLVNPDPITSPVDCIKSILSRTVTINLAIKAKYNTKDADIILKPDVGSVGVLDFTRLAECVDRGYEYTKSRMNQIRAAVATGQGSAYSTFLP